MTASGAPALTSEQRAEALRKASAVRTARRAFKDAVARGDFTLRGAIGYARRDEALAGIRVTDLLLSFPRLGPKRVEALVADAGVAEGRRLRGLGEHQIATLVARVDE